MLGTHGKHGFDELRSLQVAPLYNLARGSQHSSGTQGTWGQVSGTVGGSPGGAGAAASAGWEAWLDREWVRRLRVLAVRGAWMQAASCGVISFFTLSRSMGKIFCTNASSCCLNSRAGYLASTFNESASISDGCCRTSSSSSAAPVPAPCHSPEGCPVSSSEVSEWHAM